VPLDKFIGTRFKHRGLEIYEIREFHPPTMSVISLTNNRTYHNDNISRFRECLEKDFDVNYTFVDKENCQITRNAWFRVYGGKWKHLRERLLSK
jgi:hypothetical protein